MLHNTKELYGHKLTATDGDLGHVKDFYLDDRSWAVRYVIVDTGHWLSGRQVLLSPRALGQLDQAGQRLHVKLTRKQIEDSPSIETHLPVSRQFEQEYYRYYGWPGYWETTGFLGVADPAIISPFAAPDSGHHHGHNQREDAHLRSTKAVTGYAIEATDGELGSVRGFMVDDQAWEIRQLVVETGHWYSGKEILIAPSKVERISYDESKVFVDLTKADLQRNPRARGRESGVSAPLRPRASSRTVRSSGPVRPI